MNIIRRIYHLVGMLASGACAVLALATAPAMAATVSRPHYGPPVQAPAQTHTAVAGGMPGWQIALIAAGTAILAAVLAVTADRARATRRHVTAPGQ